MTPSLEDRNAFTHKLNYIAVHGLGVWRDSDNKNEKILKIKDTEFHVKLERGNPVYDLNLDSTLTIVVLYHRTSQSQCNTQPVASNTVKSIADRNIEDGGIHRIV